MTGCAKQEVPAVVDTGCFRYKHISFDDAQRAAVAADLPKWKTAAEQVVSHNKEYDKNCANAQPAPAAAPAPPAKGSIFQIVAPQRIS